MWGGGPEGCPSLGDLLLVFLMPTWKETARAEDLGKWRPGGPCHLHPHHKAHSCPTLQATGWVRGISSPHRASVSIGKRSLSSRHVTSTCQKTAIISSQSGPVDGVNSDPCLPGPRAVRALYNLAGQSGLGRGTLGSPLRPRPLVSCPREQSLGSSGASVRGAPLGGAD